MNKKLTNILRTNVTLYFICLVLFALAAIPFDVRLAIGEGAAAVVPVRVYRKAPIFKNMILPVLIPLQLQSQVFIKYWQLVPAEAAVTNPDIKTAVEPVQVLQARLFICLHKYFQKVKILL